MRLNQKLILGFASVAIVPALVSLIHLASIHNIKDDVYEIARSNVGEVQGSTNIAYRVATIRADISAYLLEAISGHTAESAERKHRILGDLTELDNTFRDLNNATETGLHMARTREKQIGESSELKAIEDLETLLKDYRKLIDHTFRMADTDGAAQAVALFLTRNELLEDGIRAASKALFTDTIEEVHEEVDKVGETVGTAEMVTAGLIIAAFGLAILIGMLVSNPLVRRIDRLKQATRALQEGDRDTRVPATHSKDEIAELGNAFNDMARDLQTSTASIEDLDREVQQRQQAERALKKAFDELEMRVKQRTIDLENAKLEAESANRTKSEFLANMSHELRTPLNHIIGFTELIVGEKIGKINEMQKEYLDDVLGSSHHLLMLINDILDLSKVEAGKLELMLSRVDARVMLNNCVTMFKEKAMRHGIDLVLETQHAPVEVLADEIKMKQVIYNLLSNAFKFTPDAGRIHVSASRINGTTMNGLKPVNLRIIDTECSTWAITVSDDGIGISLKDQERIFNPFEQVVNNGKTRQEGTGLGLALTRRIVELHGGIIQAHSDGPNQGATFTIVLPLEVETQTA